MPQEKWLIGMKLQKKSCIIIVVSYISMIEYIMPK